MPIDQGDTIKDFEVGTDTIGTRSGSGQGGVWKTTDFLTAASSGAAGTHEIGHLLGLPPTATGIEPGAEAVLAMPALGGALDPF